MTSLVHTDYVISGDNIIQTATTQESWSARVNMDRRLTAMVQTRYDYFRLKLTSLITYVRLSHKPQQVESGPDFLPVVLKSKFHIWLSLGHKSKVTIYSWS